MVHVAWATLAIIACLYLVLTEQTGHPPPIVLVPYVVIAWAVGHGLIWGGQQLAARGRSTPPGLSAAGQAWPISLRLTLAATGAGALVGVLQVIGTVLQRSWYPYGEAGLWGLMLVAWLAHAACFAGLLLRRRWSRLASAVLPVGWALMLGGQIAEQSTSVTAADITGIVIAGGLVALLLAVAAYLAWSREVSSFLIR